MKKFLAVIFVLVVVGMFASCYMPAVSDDETISMDEFNKIETGMSYREVVNIIGCEGELMSEVDIGEPEFATQIYTWDGNGVYGSNANVTFQGGEVVSKAQFGLE